MSNAAFYLIKAVVEILLNAAWKQGYRICDWSDRHYAAAPKHSELLYKVYGIGLWMFNIYNINSVGKLMSFLRKHAPDCYLRIDGNLVAHRHSGYCGYYDCEDVENESSETLEGWLTGACGHPTDEEIAAMAEELEYDRYVMDADGEGGRAEF